jgi:hypothetical protein
MAGKSLKIGQIRQLSTELRDIPEDGVLPDWTHLSLADRFAIALQLVPAAQRESVLGKSGKQLARYGEGTELPLAVVAALARETELPIDFIVTGRPLMRRPPVIYVTPGHHPSYSDDDVPVRKLAFQVSAGKGATLLDDAATFMRFPRSIL